jgi:hypothetical protein
LGDNYKEETDSDEDFSYLDKYRNKDKMPLKWTPKLEAKLESLLIKHDFDFNKSAFHFMKHVNEDQNEHYYEIDAKQL